MKGLDFQNHKYPWKGNLEYLPQEKDFPFDPAVQVGSRRFRNLNISKGYNLRHEKVLELSFDLELPADQYITQIDSINPNKGCTNDHRKQKSAFDFVPGVGTYDPLDLKLTLSLGVNNSDMKRSMKKSSFDRKISPIIVIDLEESTETTSNKDDPLACLDASVTFHGGSQDSQHSVVSNPLISTTTQEDIPNCIMENVKCFPMRNSFNQVGTSNDQYGTQQSDQHTRKHGLITRIVENFDLNQVVIDLEDPSCFSTDDIVTGPATTNLSGEFSAPIHKPQEILDTGANSRQEVSNFSTKYHVLEKNQGINVMLPDLNCKHGSHTQFDEMSENEAILSHESLKRSLLDLFEDPEDVDGLEHNCISNEQLSNEKAEDTDMTVCCSDQSQTTVEDRQNDGTPLYGKSFCTGEDESSCVRQHETESGNSNLLASSGPQSVKTLSGEEDEGPSVKTELKNKWFNPEQMSIEVDAFMQIAAESLVDLSLRYSNCYQHCPSEASNGVEKEKQPQCSSDSFELHTLNLTENSVDDYCVSSKPFEASDIERKDCSFKLRRGRRLKDFQKDILPGLSCLSRHEIWEDINIMDGVLRSREYRKMRGKMAGSEFVQQASKRQKFKAKSFRNESLRMKQPEAINWLTSGN